jgi:alpha-L-rhamnosidase
MNESRKWLVIALWTLSANIGIGCGGGANDDGDDGRAGANNGGEQQTAGAAAMGGAGERGGATHLIEGGASSNTGMGGNLGTTSDAGGTMSATIGGAGGTSIAPTGGTTGEPIGGASPGGQGGASTSSDFTSGGTAAATGGAATGGAAAGGAATGGTTSEGSGGTATSTEGTTTVVPPPNHLTVNGLAEPLDLDVHPRFGWHVDTAEQAAYEILVSSTRTKAEAQMGDVWTTGKVTSKAQTGIAYTGPALAASKRYFWTIRLWDPEDRASTWSSVASFGTGPGSTWTKSLPIWATTDSSNWTDYTLTAHLTIAEVAVGIRFRSADTNNGYMWQFRGTDNRLIPHRVQNGTFTVIETVTLPTGTLAIGKEVLVRIEAVGSTIKTYVNGVLIHTLTDSTFSSGGVGVRTGSTESGSLADLSVASTGGQSLVQTAFDSGDRTFGCGAVSSGALQVPKSTHCLTRGFAVDWAFLRKEFTLPNKSIAWATAYATATSPLPARQYVYKLYLNGKFVGLGPTQPIASEVRYDGFDVTSQLTAGQTNALGVLAYTTKGQAFQAELVVEYTDGTRDVIGTDKTWKGRSGDYAFPGVGSIGTTYFVAPKENLSAGDYPFGFDSAGFADGAWTAAGEKPSLGTLAAAHMAKVEERLQSPVQIVQKAAGNYFIDFGRTWIGGIQYRIANGTSGNTVEVRFGEVTSATNTVRYQLSTGNTYQDVYTLTGGAQTVSTWGMRVFRYVEILGAPEPVTVDNLKALALVYPFDAEAARFDTSDANLKQVWQLSKNTIEAVNVNFYTDSWTRERANYEADAYLQQRAQLYLSDDPTLGWYSIGYFKSNRTWPTEWPLYVILAVHDAWLRTGDAQPIADLYTSLVSKLPDAWFETTTNLIRKTTGSNGCSSTTNCDIVDWPTTQRDGYVFQQYNTVLNALAYRAYRDMAEMATVIGKTADASTYTARADALRASMNTRLYSRERIRTGLRRARGHRCAARGGLCRIEGHGVQRLWRGIPDRRSFRGQK